MTRRPDDRCPRGCDYPFCEGECISGITAHDHGLPDDVPCVNGCGWQNRPGSPVFVLTSNGPTCLRCLAQMIAVATSEMRLEANL